MPVRVLAAVVLLIAGCLTPAPAEDGASAEAAPYFLSESFEGNVAGTPNAPGEAEHAFTVPPNATHVRANLSWSDERAALALILVDPDGNEDAGFAESPTRRSLAAVAPQPGEWKLRVTTAQGLDTAYAADVVVTDAPAANTTIPFAYAVDTRIPVRELAQFQHGGYAEVNLVLEKGASFSYAWTSDAPVYFNIHYHADGKTERAVEERTDALEGEFTAPLDQVFSLLWRNESPGTANVEGSVGGVFYEHSRTR